MSDRIESRIVASAGMGLTATGLLLLVFLGPSSPLWYVMGSLMLLGLGFALFSSPNTNAVMSSVERRDYGVASATVGTMRLTGQMLSLGTAMLLFAIFIGPVQITPEVYPAFLAAMRTAFTLFAMLCFLGIFASLARGNVRQMKRAEMRHRESMTRPRVQISARNQSGTLRAHLRGMLPRFTAFEGVVGLTLTGGLSRGYGDHLSEIDVTFYLTPDPSRRGRTADPPSRGAYCAGRPTVRHQARELRGRTGASLGRHRTLGCLLRRNPLRSREQASRPAFR
jgi:MFS family permease